MKICMLGQKSLSREGGIEIVVLNSFNINNRFIISIILCILFACLDETHQIFTSGRTPLLLDILIDSIGSIVGIMIINYIIKKIN